MSGIHGIRQIAQVVRDVEAARAFYEGKLGLRVLMAFPGLCFLDCGGVRIMLTKASAPEFDHAGSILYLDVCDIDVEHARLTAAGVAFDDAPHVVGKTPDAEVWLTVFRDPDGNPLGLMEERPLAAG